MVAKPEVMIALVGVLAIATVTDLLLRRIPNWLTFPAMMAGLGLNVTQSGHHGLLFSIGGLFLGMGVFIIFYLMGGMGAGDVKLMAAVGSMIGPRMVVTAALCTALAGGIYALAVIALHPAARTVRAAATKTLMSFFYFRGVRDDDLAVEGKPPRLCYGLVITVGTIAAVILKG
jgi:prepilin peptidase CpaA